MSLQKTNTLQVTSVLDEVYPVFVILPDNIMFEDLSLEIWQRLFESGILPPLSPPCQVASPNTRAGLKEGHGLSLLHPGSWGCSVCGYRG